MGHEMNFGAGVGPYGLSATAMLETLGVKQPSSEEQAFMRQFRQNKMGNPDDIYAEYLRNVQLPKGITGALPRASTGTIPSIIAGIRRAIPLMDTAQGHQDLLSTLDTYPFTPEAKSLFSSTVVRSSSDPKVIEEEAETNRESYLGFTTGRERMQVAESGFVSPPMSVTAHELMHSYLDIRGYPRGEEAFNRDWEKAKQTTPLLRTIDRWLATSPDYVDEQNRTDLTQERFAYLAQALGGRGLRAFPPQLQPHYAPIFRSQ